MSGEDTEFNLWQVFETVVGEVGDREVVVWRDRRLTYDAMAERARRLASYLFDRGLGLHTERADLAGHQSGQDHLAIALYNSNEYLEAMLAGFRSRVASFNVNYRYVGDELRYLLADAAPRGLIYHASLTPVLAEVLTDEPPLPVLLQVADGSDYPLLPGAVPYEEALAASDPAGPPVHPSPDDLYLLYTGGTTGMPKGVLWRQHDVFLAAMGGRRMATWEVAASYEALRAQAAAGGTLKMFILPPLMHGAAQWSTFYLMLDGATFVIPDENRHLRADDVWRTLQREKVNGMTVVGDAMVRPLLDELDHQTYDTGSLFAVGNGGAPLTATVRARLLAHFPNLIISDTGGASETGAQLQALPGEPPGVFRPSPATTVLDEGLGAALTPGHPGIGWLAQSGTVPLGYLGDPEKTARTFPVVDGVRYSVPGDRARLLADGRIELLGRDSVTINSGGEKIFVEEVEAAIASHPAVADVVVTGRSSERWGQEVVAVVQLVEGGQASGSDIVDHAADHIARYKLPKAVVFVPAMVRSPSGKADYRWARAQVEAAVRPSP